MNYRHGFHAGNFADVFKHAMLTRILVYLTRKDAPLRYIDTHAGAGRYDLASDAAKRSPEWRDGVARIVKARPPAEVAALLRPYLDAVGSCDDEGKPASYPGSPALAQSLLRPQDRLALCETHAEERAALIAALGRDRRLSIVATDGYVALNAYVPPKERRGLALIDPPFEEPDESARVEAALANALKKWPRGTYALWRPIKASLDDARFLNAIAALGAPEHPAARTRRRRRRARRPFAEPAQPNGAPGRQSAVRTHRGSARPHAVAGADAEARRGRRIRLPMADAARVGPSARGDVRPPARRGQAIDGVREVISVRRADPQRRLRVPCSKRIRRQPSRSSDSRRRSTSSERRSSAVAGSSRQDAPAPSPARRCLSRWRLVWRPSRRPG